MICFCCGKAYNYCPNCSKDKDKDPRIFTMFDSEKCKNIFDTLVSKSLGKISDDECIDKLIELDIDTNEIKKESVKSQIEALLESRPVEEESKTEEIESEPEEKKVFYGKKKNKYKKIVNVLGE